MPAAQQVRKMLATDESDNSFRRARPDALKLPASILPIHRGDA